MFVLKKPAGDFGGGLDLMMMTSCFYYGMELSWTVAVCIIWNGIGAAALILQLVLFLLYGYVIL